MIDSETIRRELAGFVDRLAVPAAGAAIVDGDGRLVVAVAGIRRRGGSDPVAEDDQWHIGSCGKAITAALYARLVEAGATEWGVPIVELLPDLAGEVDPEWSAPTIDELLVCRSGMRPNLTLTQLRKAWDDESPVADQRTRAARHALSGPPRRRGTFRYSNLGYIVAGAIIERVAGTSYEEAVRAEVFDPLGITSGWFGPPTAIWGHGARLQLGSLVVGRGPAADPARPRGDNPAVMTPAGRISLTLADWAKFHRVFLDPATTFLTAASRAHLLGPPADGRGMAMGWAPAGRLDGVSYGMQGSNTRWSATALIDTAFEHTAMVVVNDGRTRVLGQSALFAQTLLAAARAAE